MLKLSKDVFNLPSICIVRTVANFTQFIHSGVINHDIFFLEFYSN